jgi:uracil-DNA glycosylase family 4
MVLDMTASATHLRLNRRIVSCTLCPRLRAHCQSVAKVKRAAFRDQTYHGKPVPNLGDPDARLLIVGLAPAAHGANRTGRMFTGDRSGDFLFRVMHEAGFANQPHAHDARDGLALSDAMITATVHCAPPANKPTVAETNNCRPYFDEVFEMLGDLRVVLCLGRIGFDAVLKRYRRQGLLAGQPAPPFGHGAEHRVPSAATILCSYHPSQQNTFTGRLTHEMMLKVFKRAKKLLNPV